MGRYKKMYNLGGALVPSAGLTNGTAVAAGLANPLLDTFDKGNKFGRQRGITSGLKQGASLASAGAALGPAGAIAGGVIGLGAGLIGSIGAKKDEERMILQENQQKQYLSEKAGMASLLGDPNSIHGNKDGGFFRDGGRLGGSTSMSNPKLKELSNQSVEVQGPSHEQGGVMLPGNNEVEGGETIAGDFVFSEELGFAQAHKPIAKAIGALEDKPMNPIRRKTMIKLKEREAELANAQELFKKQLNIQ